MKLIKAIFVNRAPFKKIDLDLNQKISILSGYNGSGKTTIMSHIVDSIYELARTTYHNEFEGRENKFYRVSSGLYSMDSSKASLVYLRYESSEDKIIDYLDIREKCDESEYNRLLANLDNIIPFSSFKNDLEENGLAKKWTEINEKEIKEIFENTILTYFPAYRFEQPSYLTDPYKVKLKFNNEAGFSGYLKNPLEVTSAIPDIANWIMDIVLDEQLYEGSTGIIRKELNDIINLILAKKIKTNVRLGIGKRYNGATRISIVADEQGGKVVQIYPSIFSMSSGELMLLSLFSEIMRQMDRLKINELTQNSISGIVLIDEIDKHLHISMQKEILPKLIKLFPNIQFIVTSHSPFFALGLEDENISYSNYDLNHDGIICESNNNELFNEVYDMFISENEKYEKLYIDLKTKLKNGNKTLIITEGKTDWMHIKNAIKMLNRSDIDVEFFEYEDTLGDGKLFEWLKNDSKIKRSNKIIGIFDRDGFENIKNEEIRTEKYIDLGNNVFAFSIPLVNEKLYGENISIEHYYKEKDLKKENEVGRRLFLGSEFFESGNSKSALYETKTSQLNNKILKNGIIDDKVFKREDLQHSRSVALSKTEFASLMQKDGIFSNDTDYSSFNEIIDIISEIEKKPIVE